MHALHFTLMIAAAFQLRNDRCAQHLQSVLHRSLGNSGHQQARHTGLRLSWLLAHHHPIIPPSGRGETPREELTENSRRRRLYWQRRRYLPRGKARKARRLRGRTGMTGCRAQARDRIHKRDDVTTKRQQRASQVTRYYPRQGNTTSPAQDRLIPHSRSKIQNPYL